jgi:hypothetical protein
MEYLIKELVYSNTDKRYTHQYARNNGKRRNRDPNALSSATETR